MLNDYKLTNSYIYIGKEAGRQIFYDIKDATKSIRIASPYISDEYIDTLINKNNSGVEVSLIISSDFVNNNDYKNIIAKLLKQNQHKDKSKAVKRTYIFRLFLGLLTASIILFYIAFKEYLDTFWYGISTLLLTYITYITWKGYQVYTYTYSTNINFHVPMSPYTNGFQPQFYLMHSKMFIIDDQIAYLGSVNYTKAAFWKNYETRITVTTDNDIKELVREFDYIRNNADTHYLDLNQVGSTVFNEPIN